MCFFFLLQPPRSAHPNVKFTCTSHEPMVIENLPFDKYELEPCPLTQYMLARKQPTVCWQVSIFKFESLFYLSLLAFNYIYNGLFWDGGKNWKNWLRCLLRNESFISAATNPSIWKYCLWKYFYVHFAVRFWKKDTAVFTKLYAKHL